MKSIACQDAGEVGRVRIVPQAHRPASSAEAITTRCITSAAGSGWQRPCSLAVDPRTGLVSLEDAPALASLAQKVVLMLLVAVQFKQWVEEVRAQRQAEQRKKEGI
jgi:hypothetical protein